MKPTLLLAILAAATCLCPAFTVVENGIPKASIVVPQNADAIVAYAAEELQHHIKLISKAELPIAPSATGRRIRLAVNPTGFNDKLARLHGTEGYAVAESADEVTLLAACSKGILNGVYRYLRKNTDIVWARPDESLGTIYTETPTLDFKKNDILDIPVFTRRGWQMGNLLNQGNEIWQNRMCCNWSSATKKNPLAERYGNITEFGSGHNLNALYITEAKYYEQHPEFFPLINGERIRPSSRRLRTQLCFSNQDMTDEFINILDGFVKENPGHTIFRVLIEDNHDRCRCPKCEEPITLPDGSLLPPEDPAFYSTRFFIFMNKLADFMQKNHPGKSLFSFAYFFTEIPPKIPVKPNIYISFAPIGKDTRFSIDNPANTKTQTYLNDWLKQTTNVIWREYYGLTNPFPRPTWRTAAADFQSISRRGVVQTYSELRSDYTESGASCWDANAMAFWIITALEWEPDKANDLENEFLTRAFGPAAEDMRMYYNLFADEWFKHAGKSTYRDSAMTAWSNCAFKTGIYLKMRECLDKAKAKITHPKQRLFLQAIRKNFDAYINACENSFPTALKTTEKVEFDPDFTTPAWNATPPFTMFYERGGIEENKKITTDLRILHDDTNIYIGVKCTHKHPKTMPYRTHEENPKGDAVFPDGEGFEVYIGGNWPKAKKPFTQLVIDPTNNRYNGVKRIKWQSQATLTKTGWSGLFVIPWKELNLEPGSQLKAAFIHQYQKAAKPGVAPRNFLASPGSVRHRENGLVMLKMK